MSTFLSPGTGSLVGKEKDNSPWRRSQRDQEHTEHHTQTQIRSTIADSGTSEVFPHGKPQDHELP